MITFSSTDPTSSGEYDGPLSSSTLDTYIILEELSKDNRRGTNCSFPAPEYYARKNETTTYTPSPDSRNTQCKPKSKKKKVCEKCKGRKVIRNKSCPYCFGSGIRADL